MRRHSCLLRLAALVLLALALIGCGAPAAASVPPSTATVAATPMPTVVPSPTATIAPTAAPSATAAIEPTAVPSATDAPQATTPTASAGSRTVTLGDYGKTITMHVGDRFLLDLGQNAFEPYDWTPIPTDPSVLSRVVNVLTIRGSQGLYEAHKPGQTELNATGEATCRQSQPPCEVPSRTFTVTVVVEP